MFTRPPSWSASRSRRHGAVNPGGCTLPFGLALAYTTFQTTKQPCLRRAVDLHVPCPVPLKNPSFVLWRFGQQHIDETASGEVCWEHLPARHHHRPEPCHPLAVEPATPHLASARLSGQIPRRRSDLRFGGSCPLGFQGTGKSAPVISYYLSLRSLKDAPGRFRLHRFWAAATHLADRCSDRRRHLTRTAGAAVCVPRPCPQLAPYRELRCRDLLPVAVQCPGPEEHADSPPVTEPPVTSMGTRIWLVPFGEVVENAPEADRVRTTRPHCGHDLGCERVFHARHRLGRDLWRADWGDDRVDHLLNTSAGCAGMFPRP